MKKVATEGQANGQTDRQTEEPVINFVKAGVELINKF